MTPAEVRSIVFAYADGRLKEPQRSAVGSAVDALPSALGDELYRAHINKVPKDEVDWNREARAVAELGQLFVMFGVPHTPHRVKTKTR